MYWEWECSSLGWATTELNLEGNLEVSQKKGWRKTFLDFLLFLRVVG